MLMTINLLNKEHELKPLSTLPYYYIDQSEEGPDITKKAIQKVENRLKDNNPINHFYVDGGTH